MFPGLRNLTRVYFFDPMVGAVAQSGSAIGAIAAIEAANETGSYRVKFARKEFIELARVARRRVIYRRRKNYFFAYDGFLVYSQECIDSDFPGTRIVEAKELSNYAWSA